MHIFYSTEIVNDFAVLSPEESFHCVRVLRLAKNDVVELIDGKGGLFSARIEKPDSKNCTLRITEVLQSVPPRNFRLHIAIAPTKNIERFEWFIEKSVEIGIDVITPLLCHHSERRILKTDRLQKLVISTMKQAKITQTPILNELTRFDEFVRFFHKDIANLFIAHCEETSRKLLKHELKTGSDAVIMIGPEGDFAHEEIDLALDKGFVPVTLGNTRLRTETAGIVACHSVNFMNPEP
jgi:16S rRNA (uracil1498-N3)-methyltransferase